MAKILIVADAPLTIDRMVAVITPLGHECIQASDGLEAVETYSRRRPAAVFIDVGMPRIDGISALSAIRATDPEARVTIVTGAANLLQVKKAQSAGAVDFILKPFNNQRLLTALVRMLEVVHPTHTASLQTSPTRVPVVSRRPAHSLMRLAGRAKGT